VVRAVDWLRNVDDDKSMDLVVVVVMEKEVAVERVAIALRARMDWVRWSSSSLDE